MDGKALTRAVAAATGVLAAVALSGCGGADATERAPLAAVELPSSAPPAPPPSSTDRPRDESWRAVAEGFARDFVNVAGGKQAWFDRLTRWTDQQLAEGYKYTELDGVPTAAFERVDLVSANEFYVTAEARYTGLTLRLQLEFLEPVDELPAKWVVIGAEPGKARSGPGA